MAVIRGIVLCLSAMLFMAVGPRIIAWFDGDEFPRGLTYVGYGVAGMIGLAGLWLLRQASVCLVVGRDGRVEFGRRTLCAEGNVKRIVVRNREFDGSVYDVIVQTRDGRSLELPWFMSDLFAKKEADELAEVLSDFLGVDRTNTTSCG